MFVHSTIDSDPETCPLLNLQYHLLERILTQLHITDLARCCQVSKAMRFVVHQEGVWQSLCTSAFPTLDRSQLRGWITPSSGKNKVKLHHSVHPESPQSIRQAPGLPTYRDLYPVLKQLDSLIGVWRHSKHPDKPALYVFDWGHCCAEGRKLCYDLPGQEPFTEPFQQVGPSHNASVQHVDDMHCLLTVQTNTQHSPVTKAVQAATAVAVGGMQNSNREQSDTIMGTSPPGSFEFEMQRFMQGHMANKQPKRRRSGNRSTSGALPIVHTLTRVEMPVPTQRHPLAGVWRSTGMSQTCIMTVRYDFSHQRASIRATQAMGQGALLQGWRMWAAPISKPWQPSDSSMLAHQAELSLLNGDFDHFDESGSHDLSPDKEVVQIFKGEVEPSSTANGQWVFHNPQIKIPGHLWLYADGTIGIIFKSWDPFEVLVNMKRIDEDLQLQ